MARKPTIYWIKERRNFNGGHYFSLYGLLSKAKAKSIEEGSLGGHNYMHPYSTEEEYNSAIQELEQKGMTIL